MDPRFLHHLTTPQIGTKHRKNWNNLLKVNSQSRKNGSFICNSLSIEHNQFCSDQSKSGMLAHRESQFFGDLLCTKSYNSPFLPHSSITNFSNLGNCFNLFLSEFKQSFCSQRFNFELKIMDSTQWNLEKFCALLNRDSDYSRYKNVSKLHFLCLNSGRFHKPDKNTKFQRKVSIWDIPGNCLILKFLIFCQNNFLNSLFMFLQIFRSFMTQDRRVDTDRKKKT